MWRHRLKKFTDNPLVVFTFARNHLYYTFIADKWSASYDESVFISSEETIAKITSSDTSLIRIGDGTFGYLLGASIYFNNWHFRYNRTFARKLEEALQAGQSENILFCFPHPYILKSRQEFIAEGIAAEWRIWVAAKVLVAKYLRKSRLYGNSFCFHPKHNPNIDFTALKSYLTKKHIIIITSHISRFESISLGQSTSFVEAPASDAWQVYTSLEEQTLAIIKRNDWSPKDVLVLVSAAEAAKVIVYDLTKSGYTAWDTGQFFDLASQEIKNIL